MRAGFSLIEMTVAVAIVLAVTGAVFALMDPVHGAFRAQPDAMDEQQRIRVAAEAIGKELLNAGAGTQTYFAVVLPFRRGLVGAGSPDAAFFDRVSTMSIPVAAPETVVSVPTDSGPAVYVSPRTGCPTADPLCGFAPDMLAVIFDQAGFFDTFRISAVQDEPPALLRAAGTLSRAYPAGAVVAQIAASTFWVRHDAATGASELMRYDGALADLPVVDDVDGLAFEYYGDPSPPVLQRPLSDPYGPWTSYGPRPPAIDEDDPATPSYGPGENCLFTVVDGVTVGRTEVGDPGSGSTLVRLDQSRLTDGPWCPDPSAPNRFDADLLRVRHLSITFRVRGKRVALSVTPRNLSLPR